MLDIPRVKVEMKLMVMVMVNVADQMMQVPTRTSINETTVILNYTYTIPFKRFPHTIAHFLKQSPLAFGAEAATRFLRL